MPTCMSCNGHGEYRNLLGQIVRCSICGGIGKIERCPQHNILLASTGLCIYCGEPIESKREENSKEVRD